MAVYDFLSLATDLSNCNVRVFDFTTEEVVFDSRNCDDDFVDITIEISLTDYDNYEVLSYDIYKTDDGLVVLELNIEVED